jgi:outer membrane protein assembly factor BamB
MLPQLTLPTVRTNRGGFLRPCIVALVTLAFMSACGGGGGGSSGSSGDSSSSGGSSSVGPGGTDGSGASVSASVSGTTSSAPSSGDVTMSISPLSVTVSAFTREPAPTIANFGVNLSNLQVGLTYYVQGLYSTHGIASITGGPLFDIQFKDPTTLGAGVYTDSVQFKGCYDQACSQQVTDSPQTVQITYTVTASLAQVTSLSPSSAIAGSQGFTATITGSNFSSLSEVSWNGASLPLVTVSDTQLTVQVPAFAISTPGSSSVYVSGPTTGTSNTVSFTDTNSPIQLSSLSPSSAVASGPVFLLTVNGSQFGPQTMVLWNGSPQPTAVLSTTQLVATISAADVATAGSVPVSVSDPVAGRPSPLSFTVSPATLTLESLSPTGVTVGGPPFLLTVLGAGFTNLSVVQWNGSPRPTTSTLSNGSYELIAQVSAADIAALGSAQVTVQDSGGSGTTTPPLTLNIVAPSKDAVAFQLNAAHTGAVNFGSFSLPTTPAWTTDVGGTAAYTLIVNGTVYVTVGLSDGTSNVLALDGITGATVWGPVKMSGASNAAYDSGRLFVAAYPEYGPPTLEALDAQTGVELWSTSLTGAQGYDAAPTAANGLVFLGNEAIDEATGAVLWQAGVISLATDTVTFDGVYLAYQCYTQMMRPATGETVWSEPCSPNEGGAGPAGVAVVANQRVYAQTSYQSQASGSIYDAETGANYGTYLSDVPPALTATVSYYLQGGTFQYGSFTGATLSAVQQSDATTLWNFTGDGGLVTSPIVINQYVFIGSTGGNVYALDGATGQQVWQVSLGGVISQGARWGAGSVLSGLSAGDGLLVIPNGTKVTTYVVSTSP